MSKPQQQSNLLDLNFVRLHTAVNWGPGGLNGAVTVHSAGKYAVQLNPDIGIIITNKENGGMAIIPLSNVQVAEIAK